jgi:putative nucleotidyltransferase with HDIG domain
MGKVIDITSALASIPPFPQIAIDVVTLLNDPTAPVQRIISLVEKDVALTTAILRLANSGLYGRRRSIGTVRSAFLALGAEDFAETVMRTSVKKYLNAATPRADLNRCWAHSVACSEIAKILAAGLNLPPDVAQSAGLLHDLGRFGLAISAPDKHNELLNGVCSLDVIDAEREIFGMDHTEVGRLLAEQFNLPDEIRVAAGRHHDNFSGDEPDMLAVVTVACRVASAVGFQVVTQAIPKSLDDVIAAAPAPMRGRISNDAEGWTVALLSALGSN